MQHIVSVETCELYTFLRLWLSGKFNDAIRQSDKYDWCYKHGIGQTVVTSIPPTSVVAARSDISISISVYRHNDER
jgi:hypothetical protein